MLGHIRNCDCEIRPENSPLVYIQRIVECFCGEQAVEDYGKGVCVAACGFA